MLPERIVRAAGFFERARHFAAGLRCQRLRRLRGLQRVCPIVILLQEGASIDQTGVESSPEAKGKGGAEPKSDEKRASRRKKAEESVIRALQAQVDDKNKM